MPVHTLFKSASGLGDHGLRLARESSEALRGLLTFRDVAPAVTIFGSARFSGEHPYALLAEKTGELLAKEGYTVITGGGPGLMEAASRGAKKAGGRTVGVNIVIPHEQRLNSYIDRAVTLSSFWGRKTLLIRHSSAFIVLPGGFGTLDEVTEVLTLMQAGKMKPLPVVLIGSSFWSGFVDFCRDPLLREGAISQDLLDLFQVVNTPDEALDLIREASGR